ncbi:SRPBCC family protein [Ferrovibrio sp.]|uniref:SRPBCC family protein n=1 Tax=Ferrovibrio sp. TaxID=1917215 RepID=UPI000CBBAD61|nr:SRPBCC family protein [Ferrovibrio sp.]PJI43750.1 MAG: polyketide cyclase [Ferrovibrio sp.]
MLKIALIGVAVILVGIAGLLAYASTRPDTSRIARAARIEAAPERIFALINDLPAWQSWSPYEKKDPDMQRSFTGPAAGLGAQYAWAGDRTIGEGRMEIVESTAPSKVAIRLEFLKPFQHIALAEFTLQPDPNGATTVTWAMTGPANLISKVMSVFFNFDRMIGGDFEAGLADLKTLAEK